jgi:PAS domain S-box-containing protein
LGRRPERGAEEASPSPVYGAALLMRFGLIAHPGFESRSLRQRCSGGRKVPLTKPSVDITAALLDQVRVAVVAVDLSNHVTHWNREAEQLYGWSADEVIGQTSTSIGVAPTDKENADEIARRILAGESWTGEFPVMTKSGVYKRMHFHAGPVRDETGAVIGLVSVASDAEEMEETAAQLSLFQSALGQSPVGVGMYDEELNYVRANQALLDIIGLPLEQVRGRRVRDVLGPVLGQQVESFLTRVFATGDPVINHEVHGPTPLHPDEDRWYQVSYFRLTDNAGRVVGAASLVSDVDEEHRIRDRLHEVTERLALLGKVSELLASSLQLDKTLAALARLVVPGFADHCVVDLIDDNFDLVRRAVVHAPEITPFDSDPWAPPGEIVTYPDAHPVAQALASGRAVTLHAAPSDIDYDALAPTPESADYARRVGVQSAIAVPLVSHGETIGVVSFALSVSGRRYTLDDQRLAQEIAVRAAVAIDNAQLFRREQQTALTLQRSLLPGALPETEDLQAAAAYFPAGDEGEVGGDWYDVIPLPSGRVAIVIGDVMGRGIRAAALMGQLRAVVRGYAVQDMPPVDVVAYLDDLVRSLDDASIVTCVYAVYDPVDRAVCISNAGHLPPLLVNGIGATKVLNDNTGIALGAGKAPFEQFEVELNDGDALVLYTDGLVETRGSDIDDGIATLATAVSPLPDSLDEACARALSVRTPDAQDDDVAVLVVRARTRAHAAAVAREFVPTAENNGEMRAWARATLAAWDAPEETARTVELVVSEFVTNVIRYAVSMLPERPRVRLARRRDEVFVEVTDWNGTLPHRRQARPSDEVGRGLALVESIASRWGSRPILGGGKAVWCALPWISD